MRGSIALYSMGTLARSNWNLEIMVFEERGKPENPVRNLSENQQKTQPTYHAKSGNRSLATLVGGECFHHCAIPAVLWW